MISITNLIIQISLFIMKLIQMHKQLIIETIKRSDNYKTNSILSFKVQLKVALVMAPVCL